jgi:hypothetical protein
LLLAVVAWLSAAVMTALDRAHFEPYFGDAHPVVVVTVVLLLGLAAVTHLGSRGWFVNRADAPGPHGRFGAALIATLLAALMITIDAIAVPFSADINVPVPQALLFYPVMALVVEVVFHLVPLTLLLVVVERLATHLAEQRRVWASVLAVALLEPVFQVSFAADAPLWMAVYLPLHLYVFNVVQLWLFKRHDFFTMLAFRLIYYLHWHILWGHLRLQLLF